MSGPGRLDYLEGRIREVRAELEQLERAKRDEQLPGRERVADRLYEAVSALDFGPEFYLAALPMGPTIELRVYRQGHDGNRRFLISVEELTAPESRSFGVMGQRPAGAEATMSLYRLGLDSPEPTVEGLAERQRLIDEMDATVKRLDRRSGLDRRAVEL